MSGVSFSRPRTSGAGSRRKAHGAEYVRPFVKSNKNDYVDAEAIAEAVQRPTMRFVPIKNEAQLDLQALHRVRDRWIGRRTAVINQLRGFLLEHGITVNTGPAHLKRKRPVFAVCTGAVSVLMMWAWWRLG